MSVRAKTLPLVLTFGSYVFDGKWMPPIEGKRVLVYEARQPTSLAFLVAVDHSGDLRELCIQAPKEPPPDVISAVGEAIFGEQTVRYQLVDRHNGLWIYRPEPLSGEN